MVNTPVLLIQPLNTLLSGCTSLGTDSPVSAEVSKKEVETSINMKVDAYIGKNYIEDEMQLHSEEEEEFFMITKSFFQPIEMKFNINVDSYEISLLYEIFKSYIM